MTPVTHHYPPRSNAFENTPFIRIDEHPITQLMDRAPQFASDHWRHLRYLLVQATLQGIPWGGQYGNEEMRLIEIPHATEPFNGAVPIVKASKTLWIVKTVLTYDQAMANMQMFRRPVRRPSRHHQHATSRGRAVR